MYKYSLYKGRETMYTVVSSSFLNKICKTNNEK